MKIYQRVCVWIDKIFTQTRLINFYNEILPAFIAFGSILKHFNQSLLQDAVHLWWTNSENTCFQTTSQPQKLWNLIPKPGIFPTQSRTVILSHFQAKNIRIRTSAQKHDFRWKHKFTPAKYRCKNSPFVCLHTARSKVLNWNEQKLRKQIKFLNLHCNFSSTPPCCEELQELRFLK